MAFKSSITIFLILVFFFLETTISFSTKKEVGLFNPDEKVSFAMSLSNEDSDFPLTKNLDRAIDSFLTKNHIAGASVAITQNEKLVYAKGFGIANDETNETVHPGHLFRIASVSKLITAVAIMRLYEQGKLSLTDPVFGPDGILNEPEFQNYKDQRINQITIANLLNHTGGWYKRNGNSVFDPVGVGKVMKSDKPADLNLIIQYSLKEGLRHRPGTYYSYSNFGYAVLGKVIEKISNMKYEDYVIMNVLRPAGIYDMHIGRNLYEERFPNEVKYFEAKGSEFCPDVFGNDSLVPKTYGGNDIPLIGAAGGWIASASEMVKFLTVIDGFSQQADILSKETLQMMTNPEVAGPGLFGWRGSDKKGSWWRTGTLSGTTALIMRQENGINWVVLINSSDFSQNNIHSKIAHLMAATLKKTPGWPQIDLFQSHNEFAQTNLQNLSTLLPL